MNLALGAILLAILLIPPLILYYAYNAGNYAKAAPKMTVLEYLLVSAVLSLILHCLIIYIWKLDIDFEFLFRVLSGQMTEKFVDSSKVNVGHYFHQFSLYIFKVCVGAAFVGWLLSRITRWRRLRMSRFFHWIRRNRPPGNALRYFNKWWYFFRSYEYSSQYRYLGNQEPVILINLLIETKDASVLYEGTLVDWVADGETLDRVYITAPTKRLFNKRTKSDRLVLTEGSKVEIESDGLLCIPYSKVTNMHIQFISTVVVVAEDGIVLDDEASIEAINEVEEADLSENLSEGESSPEGERE